MMNCKSNTGASIQPHETSEINVLKEKQNYLWRVGGIIYNGQGSSVFVVIKCIYKGIYYVLCI